MKDLKRVYVTQDHNNDWYSIPFESQEDFMKYVSNLKKASFRKSLYEGEKNEKYYYKLLDTFITDFGKYIVGGDINLIELYAKI